MPVPAPDSPAVVGDNYTNRFNLGVTLRWLRTGRSTIQAVSFVQDGPGIVRVTSSGPHGLTIANLGLWVFVIADGLFDGLHQVTNILTATTFTISTDGNEIYGSLGAGLVVPEEAHFGYEIEWDRTNAGGWVLVQRIHQTEHLAPVGTSQATNTYRHLYVTPGREHRYRIRAYDCFFRYSAYTTVQSTTLASLPAALAAPVLTVYRPDPTYASLDWTVENSDAKHYEIERSENGGAWQRIYYSADPEIRISYGDTGLSPASSYRWRVRHRYVKNTVLTYSNAGWQNQDDPLDVNNDGAVDYRDFRLLLAWLSDHWPDFGNSLEIPSSGSTRPNRNPVTDPPVVSAEFAPLGAMLDPSGDDGVSGIDTALLANHANAVASYPPRSAWSNIATAAATEKGWHLYLGAQNGLFRSWLDGRNIERLDWNHSPNLENVRAVSIDKSRAHVYYLANTPAASVGHIWRNSLDGSGEPEIVLFDRGKNCLVVDEVHGKIYFDMPGELRRANLDGSGEETILRSSTSLGVSSDFTCLAVDPTYNEQVFFSVAANGDIWKADLDGSLASQVYSGSEAAATTLAYNGGDNRLYFGTTAVDRRLRRIELNGSSVTTILSGEHYRAITFDPIGEKIVWTSNLGIRRASYTGSLAETVASTGTCTGNIIGLALYQHGSYPAVGPAGLSLSVSGKRIVLTWSVTGLPASHQYVEIQRLPISGLQDECDWQFVGVITTGSPPVVLTTFQDSSPDLVGGTTYRYRVRSSPASVVPNSTRSWHHIASPADVTNDGVIGYQDYQTILDRLNSSGAGSLPEPRPSGEPYYDVSGDGFITALDSQLVLSVLQGWANLGPPTFWSATAEIVYNTTTTPHPEAMIAQLLPIFKQELQGRPVTPCAGLYLIKNATSARDRIEVVTYAGSPPLPLVSDLVVEGTSGDASQKIRRVDAASLDEYGVVFYVIQMQFGETVWWLRRFDVTTGYDALLMSRPAFDPSLFPTAIISDPENKKVYYSQQTSIWRTDFDGTATQLMHSGSRPILDVKIDVCNQKIYWTADAEGVYRGDIINSGTPRIDNIVLLIPGGQPAALDVAQPLNRLVFVDRDQNRLYAADLAGVIYGYQSLGAKADLVTGVVIDQDTANVFYSIGGASASIWVVELLLQAEPTPAESIFLPPGGVDDYAGVSLCNNACLPPAPTTTTTLYPPVSGVIQQLLPPVRQALAGEIFTVTTTTTTPPPCSHVFWLDSQQRHVQRANYDGSGRVSLQPHGSNYGQIQLAPDIGRVFWVDTDAGAILSSTTDGSDLQTVVSGLVNPYGLVIHPDFGWLFWGDATENKLERVNWDGSNRQEIIPAGSFGELRHLAIDTVNDRLYLCDIGVSPDTDDSVIYRSGLDGSGLIAIRTGLNSPLGIAVDPAASKVYYANSGSFEVRSCNLSGGSDTLLYTLSPPLDLVFDLVVESGGDHLWWCQPYQKHIIKARSDGDRISVAIDLSGLVYYQANSLAVCGDSDILPTTTTTTSTTTTPSPGSIVQILPRVRQALVGSIIVTTTTSTTYAPDYCRGVYFTDPVNLSVVGLNRDGTDAETLFSGFGNPVSAASNTASAVIYVVDQSTSQIWRLAMDGSYQEMIVDLAGSYTNLRGLAHHPGEDRLFFLDRSAKKLLSVNSDGTGLTVVIDSLFRPFEVAVDTVLNKVYWSDDNAIRRANLDGTAAEDFVTDRNVALGLDIDSIGRWLFWVEGGANEIYRAPLDGGTATLVRAGLSSPRNLRLDPVLGRILFTESGLSTIGEMSYAGDDLSRFATTSVSRPYALALCLGATSPDSPTTTTTTAEPTTTTTTTAPPTTTTTTAEPTTTTTAEPTTTTTCAPDAGTVAGGRRQISVDQHQGGENYPFVGAPSDDLDLLIADCYLRYVDPGCGVSPPFKIDWLSCFGDLPADRPDDVCRCNAYDLKISDSTNTVIFDTREALLTHNVMWGDTLRVVEWSTPAGGILRIVKFEGWDPNRVSRNWPEYFEPSNAVLDPRTIEFASPAIPQLTVETVDEDGTPVTYEIDGSRGVIFKSGYNVEIGLTSQSAEDGQLASSTLTLTAEPNSGLGRYPGCESPVGIYQINSSTPDERGNLAFDALGCYRVQPVIKRVISTQTDNQFEVVEIEPGKLLVTNDCGPCCTCEDFSRVYEAIRRVWLKYKQLGKRAEAVRDLYQQNVVRWDQNRACREGTQLRCVLLPVYPCRAAVGIGLCNNTDEPLKDVELELDFGQGGTTSGGCVVCSSTLRRGNVDPQKHVPTGIWQPYKLIGEFPVLRAHFDCINPGELGTVVTQIDFPGAGDGDQVCVRVRIVKGANTDLESRCCTGLVCSGSEGCCEIGGSSSLEAPPDPVPGTSGSIRRIVSNFGTGTCRILVSNSTPHQLSVGDRVEVTGTSVAAYNRVHTITDQATSEIVPGSTMITDVAYTEQASGGSYRKLEG